MQIMKKLYGRFLVEIWHYSYNNEATICIEDQNLGESVEITMPELKQIYKECKKAIRDYEIERSAL